VKKRTIIYLISPLWLCLVGFGMLQLWNYANTPGKSGLAPSSWPESSHLSLSKLVPTMVIFAHPHCPCSQATAGELNEILAKVHRKLTVYVLFVSPKNPKEDWTETKLWSDTKAIPGVQTLLDEGGIEAKRFGAKSSGQVNLYDVFGRLVFSGGITSARGHYGDNLGKSAVISFVNDKKVTRSTTPVFGCTLYED